MSEPESSNPLVAGVDQALRPVAPVRTQSDRALLILAGVSLIVHATIFLPSLLRRSQDDAVRPKEIPVELVQVPPPPKPETPKPKAPAPKPPAPKVEQKPPQKVAEDKPKPPAKPAPKQVAKQAATPAPKSVAERLKDLLGPMPAVAMPASTDTGTDTASYTQLVLSKLAKAKKEGSYKGVPGATSVSFTLGDSGEVASVEIVRPSGDPSLDAEAIAMVKRGAPYPAPPPGGRRDYTITLRFQALI